MNLVEHNTSGVGLRGNVSQDEALRLFANAGLAGALRRARIGRLQRVAAAYVPFEIYRVSYEMGKRRQTRLFAQDQVEGLLDLFEFPELPGGEEFVSIESTNCLPVGLGAERAEFLLKEKVLRLLFQSGFFKVRAPRVSVETVGVSFGIPYWLGFYGEDGSLRCRVLDAVRRRMEGEKATVLFEQWLAA